MNNNSGKLRICLCGYYHVGSRGDDMLMKRVAKVLSEFGKVRVTNCMVFDREVLDWCDLLVEGGGTLIHERGIASHEHVRHVKSQGKMVMFYAQTIEDGHPLFAEHVRLADAITVRDSRSKELLAQYGVPCVQSVDPVFCPDRRAIGFSFREWVTQPEDVIERLADVLCDLSRDYELVSMPFTTAATDTVSDRQFHAWIIERLERRPRSMSFARGLRKVNALVAMRLHALIVALNRGKETIAIAYDGKVRNIMTDLGLEDRVFSYSEIERIPDCVRRRVFAVDAMVSAGSVEREVLAELIEARAKA